MGHGLIQWAPVFSISKWLLSLLPKKKLGTSLAIQWLRLCASTAGGMGSIPVRELRCRAVWQKKKKKKQHRCGYFKSIVI